MQNRVINYLRQPYPCNIRRVKMIVISSLLVFFLLAVLQPFGIGNIKEHKFVILLGYMFVTFLSLSVLSYLFPVIWKNYYIESNWTVGKEFLNLLLIVLTIGLGNSCYSSLVFSTEMNLMTIVSCLIVTLLISVFPITLFIILRQNRLLSKELKTVTEMNNRLTLSRTTFSHSDKVITIEGTGKETLELDINEFLCAEANGNYVNISYTGGGKTRKKVLRSTIKQMEEVFDEFPFVVRCHRAFLVNINAIDQVKGNSQGYRLLVSGIEEEIPVSRAYAKQVKDQIDAMSSEEE